MLEALGARHSFHHFHLFLGSSGVLSGIYSRFTLLLPTTFLLIYKETADLTVASAFV